MVVDVTDSPGSVRQDVRLLTTVSIAHMASHFHMMTVPALIPLLPKYFGVSFLDIGVALTVFNLVSLVVQAPLGFATDMIGARRLLVTALLLGGLSLLCLAFTNDYAWLVTAMAAAGLVNGVYHPADYALLSAGIGRSRIGRAFSLHTFAGYIGTAIAPAALLSVAAAGGVEMSFAVAGLIGIAVALLVLTCMPRQSIRRYDHHSIQAKPTAGLGRLAVITPTVLSLTMLFVLLSLSTSGIQNFSVAALVAGYGVELSLANVALTSFLFASAFGVLAGGAVADRTSRHGHVAIIAFLLTALLILLVAVVRLPSAVLVLVMSTAGFLSGAIAPSRDMLVRSAAQPGAEGRVFGIVSTGFNIGGVAGPILFGWLLAHAFPQFVFGASVVFMVLTVGLTLFQERRRPAVMDGRLIR